MLADCPQAQTEQRYIEGTSGAVYPAQEARERFVVCDGGCGRAIDAGAQTMSRKCTECDPGGKAVSGKTLFDL